MLKLNKLLTGAALTAAGLSITASAAFAEKVLRIQSVLPNTADEVVRLKDIYFGMMQFMVMQLSGLILILVFPQIVLWLPNQVFGG